MTEPNAGQIATFYSFKGGTGRTMALANVAWILAANGKRVLVADWDLESPGLHRFFKPFLDPGVVRKSEGIIDLIRAYEWEAARRTEPREQWIAEFARVKPKATSLKWPGFPSGGTLDYLSAGRQDSNYAAALSGMSWDNFYDNLGGGTFLDALRADMKRNYDYTLIDSRTGLSDVADICTIHLPDILVDCFTLSDQGIEGAAQVAEIVKRKYYKRNIRILPVAMRVDGAESDRVEAGRELAKRRIGSLPADLADAERQQYWTDVEVPYHAKYAYEETLATFGDAPRAPATLLSAFERLTGYLTAGQITSLPPMDEEVRAKQRERFRRRSGSRDDEIVLLYAPRDVVWAEWLESLLTTAGYTVLEPNAAGAGVPSITIISSPESAYLAGAATVGPSAGNSFAVYVSDMRPLGEFPVGRWASIFGIAEDKAVGRVLQLIGHTASQDVAANRRFPGQDHVAYYSIPPNINFTGREESLRDLRNHMRALGGVVVLQGIGGVGKTQVALEYVHRYGGAYDIVWWINSDPAQFVDSALSDLSARLGVSIDANPVENARIMVQALSSGQPTDRWLIVLDNAEAFSTIEKLVPQGPGHVIITARNTSWKERLAHPIEIEVFGRDESVAHLKRRLPTISDDEAGRIGEALGHLPLAIANAGAYLAESNAPVADYLQQIEGEGTKGRTVSVQKNWDISLDDLRSKSVAAYRMLQLCSLMASETAFDIIYSEEMVAELSRVDPMLETTTELAALVQHINRLALLKFDVTNRQIAVHRLLQDIVVERMQAEEDISEARHRIHLMLAALRPQGIDMVDNPAHWSRYRMLWPHLLISEAVTCDDPKVRLLLIDRVRYLWKSGDLRQGEEFALRVVEYWEQLLAERGAKAPESRLLRQHLLTLRFNLANILRSQARFHEAHDIDEDVLEKQKELFAPNESHSYILMTAGSLAADMRSLGRFQEALGMDLVTHKSWLDSFGEDDPKTLAAANNLASSHRLMGDFRQAQGLDEKVLNRRRVALGLAHPLTLHSHSCLGRDYRDAGDYKISVAMLSDVYQQICALRGRNLAEAFIAQANLAASLRSDGQAHEAMPMLEEAYQFLRINLGQTSAETQACRLSRSTNLLAVGKDEEAEHETSKLIETYRVSLGENHPHTLVCINNMAAVQRALNRPEKAAEYATTAARELARTLGPDHPFTLAAQTNLAICLAEAGNLTQARTVCADTHRRSIAVLGEDHADTLRTDVNLAMIDKRMGVERPALDDAIARLAQKIGIIHPTVKAMKEGKFAHRVLDPHPF
jgi:MinD-like ATPase involved in chromosome partitioning or flagellar assembly/tetratricopeptide (TPR) repeat protein